MLHAFKLSDWAFGDARIFLLSRICVQFFCAKVLAGLYFFYVVYYEMELKNVN